MDHELNNPSIIEITSVFHFIHHKNNSLPNHRYVQENVKINKPSKKCDLEVQKWFIRMYLPVYVFWSEKESYHDAIGDKMIAYK